MIKFILAISQPIVSWIRQLSKERHAARYPDTIPNDIADTILDRSLARLGAIDEDASLCQRAISKIGGIIIRPSHFRKPLVRKWLTQNASHLKQIAKDALATDKPQDKLCEHLIDTYSSIPGETIDRAETAVKTAVAVLKNALLQRSKDVGTAAIVQEGIKSIHRRLDVPIPIPISTQSHRIVESSVNHMNTDVQTIKEKFGDASRLLLDWPQETDGQWMDRPELDQLYKIVYEVLHRRCDSVHLDVGKSNAVVLIGAPGTGKSATLGRLGKNLMEESVILLAIKADQLPKSINVDTGIDKWLGCPVVESLRKLTVTHHVVVLIDQLDALSELMDQHTERLSALLRLVQSIRRIPNLCVLLSCREFEYQNDIRLRSLEAESITLEVPPWEKVSPILTARGIDVARLVDEQREMLQVPQHLAVLMTHFSGQVDVPAVSTYQALLEDLFENRLRKSYGSKTVVVAEYIATVMAKDEELWVARGRFDRTHNTEITHLISEKIIVSSDNGLSIAFRHQTVFDFLRARSFVREDSHLKDFVVREKMQSLFVRPILWSALHYLRGSDRAVYRREMSKLWLYRPLRMHVRYLLINFLGQLTDPDEQESGWLISMLSDLKWKARILVAMAGSRGWFEKMRQRIPPLMIAGLDEAKLLLPLIIGAIRFAQDEVIDLVARYWVGRREYRRLAWQVFANLRSWDQPAVRVMVTIVSRGPVNPSVEFVMQRISRLQPALAAELLFQYLRSMDPKDAQAALNSNVWYGIEDLAKKEPRAFIRKGWTWLVDTLQQMVEEPDSHRYSYPSNFYRRDVGESLPKSFDVAICRLVETDTAYFLKLVRDNKYVDNMVVHQFLIHGLVLIAGEFPHIVRDYLLESSSRRLAVGDLSNVHKDSQRLIAAVVPALSDCDVERLETAVIDWKWTDDVTRDPKNRFQLMKLMREHRLRLLLSFPKSRLSSAGRRYLTEGLRAFPCVSDYSYFSTKVQEVVSPMGAEQMMKAHDEHIVSLFRCLTDDKESPPRLRLDKYVGGSLEASRSFAEFAKSDPHRALRIIDEFQAKEQERPAGHVLAELGATSVSSAILISCIEKLDLRGFTSERFRSEASRCLHDVAIRSKGLDDSTCALLEQWMIDCSAELDEDSRNQRSVPFGHDERSTGDGRSFLWDHVDGQVLPSGNYPILEALTAGYLYREPRDVQGWLGALERHVGRAEKAEVWIAMARYLHVLGDRPQSVGFLETLIFRYPEILNHQLGVHLIAQVVEWIPIATLRRTIDQWIDGRWQYGPQVAGEIIALSLCRGVDRRRMKRLIARTERRFICSINHSESLRVGIAHTLIVALKEPDLRSMVTPLVIRLIQSIRTSDRRLSKVVSRVLCESILLPDRHTERLLRVFLKASNKLTEVSTWHFTNGLKHLLTQAWNPRLIYTVTDAFLTQRYGSNQEPGDRFDISEQLIEVALTLHNLPDTRREGLDLFERLLAWDSYSVNYRLRTLDRHPS